MQEKPFDLLGSVYGVKDVIESYGLQFDENILVVVLLMVIGLFATGAMLLFLTKLVSVVMITIFYTIRSCFCLLWGKNVPSRPDEVGWLFSDRSMRVFRTLLRLLVPWSKVLAKDQIDSQVQLKLDELSKQIQLLMDERSRYQSRVVIDRLQRNKSEERHYREKN